MTAAVSATPMACRPATGFLVRPDGYVGAIAGSDDLSALERYLAQVGVTASKGAVV
jgi:hypothetical protein